MAYSLRSLTVKTQGDAERELASLGIDPFGIRNMGPKMLHRLFLVERIDSGDAAAIKKELLARGGDAAIAGGRSGRTRPETSLVLMGTIRQLRSICAWMQKQAFGLPALGTDILGLLDRESEPAHTWLVGDRVLELSRRPCVMGILNITPDSFSDGSRYLSAESAVERALAMEEEGADIIDIGGESTRPNAEPVSIDEELRRIMPVLEGLSGRLNIPVSVDTFKSAVAKEALDAGAEIVNDISALTFDERMVEIVSVARAGLVLMHTRGRPTDMQKDTVYSSLVGEVSDFLRKSLLRAVTAGIDAERIVIDPGIGFGKSVDGNLELLRRLTELTALGRPIMVGTSRKSFIGAILGRPVTERIFGTAATMALALANGASIFRVHDVRAMRDTVDMAQALTRPAAGTL